MRSHMLQFVWFYCLSFQNVGVCVPHKYPLCPQVTSTTDEDEEKITLERMLHVNWGYTACDIGENNNTFTYYEK